MKIWAISDTHFSSRSDFTMEGFGPIWNNHMDAIKRNWRASVGPADTVIIGGDISWEKKPEDALKHLRELNDLPGLHKILIKGNHDHWWKSTDKLNQALPRGMQALYGNALKIKGQVICGTRGWLSPNDPCSDELDKKTFDKELALFRQALDQALELDPTEGIHAVLHFPCFTTDGEETPFWDLLTQYPVRTVTYGHFHMPAEWEVIPKGEYKGVRVNLTATDFIEHRPALIFQD